MSVKSIHVIPDANRIGETAALIERWKVNLEYNDFFIPDLLDNKDELKKRINLYRSLNRPVGTDTLHGVFFDMCINSADKKIAGLTKDRMRSSMEIASELGCKGVVFHTNLIPGFEPDNYLNGWLNSCEAFYRELLDEYKNLEIYLENMFDYKPDMLIEIAENMKDQPRFGICFDVAHSNIHMIPMVGWMEVLAPYIKHLHINDNDGRCDDHKALGLGNIDWATYFETIDRLNIDASLLVEVASLEAQEESLGYLKDNQYLNL